MDLFKLRDVLSDGVARLDKMQAALKTSNVAAVRKEFAEAFALDIAETEGAVLLPCLTFQDITPYKDYKQPDPLARTRAVIARDQVLGHDINAIIQLIQTTPNQSVAQMRARCSWRSSTWTRPSSVLSPFPTSCGLYSAMLC